MSRKRAVKKAYWSEEGRLSSFADWPFGDEVSCTAEKMAAAGFFCTRGKNDAPDNVSCFMCCKDLDGWEEDDDPMKEHIRHSPACPFMNLHLEANRLKTFKHWPHKSKKTGHTKKDFAQAGFVHAPGDSAGWDNVRCFTCNKNLGGWEDEDIPMEEHRSHSKNCPFVLAHTADEKADHSAMDTLSAEEVQSEDALEEPPESLNESSTTVDTDVSMDLDTDEDDSVTVEQYLKNQCEKYAHQLVHACEKRISEFSDMATKVRSHIECN